jgi:hypothetical protein
MTLVKEYKIGKYYVSFMLSERLGLGFVANKWSLEIIFLFFTFEFAWF